MDRIMTRTATPIKEGKEDEIDRERVSIKESGGEGQGRGLQNRADRGVGAGADRGAGPEGADRGSISGLDRRALRRKDALDLALDHDQKTEREKGRNRAATPPKAGILALALGLIQGRRRRTTPESKGASPRKTKQTKK